MFNYPQSFLFVLFLALAIKWCWSGWPRPHSSARPDPPPPFPPDEGAYRPAHVNCLVLLLLLGLATILTCSICAYWLNYAESLRPPS